MGRRAPGRGKPSRTSSATLGWVYRHNNSRLHSYLDDVPPAEFEATFYDAPRTGQTLVEIQ
jgi:putative transposase